MNHFFTVAVLSATVASGIALGCPLLLAALGETVGQRSGVLNLGVDGIMLLSAFGAYFVALRTGSIALGVLVALGIGAVMGLITAFMNVTVRAEQGISGIAIYIAALGLSGLLFERYVGTPLPITNTRGPFAAVDIPLLDRIPYLGTMFFKQNVLVYLAILLIPVLTFALHRTTYGMKVQAAGENPAAADTLGISVSRVRYSAVIFGCTMAGLAGAALLIVDGIFQENLTQGAGFIAVALVYFGGWRPGAVALGALLYGLTGAVILTWKTLGIIPLSLSDLAATAPAVIVVLALLFLVGRYRQPTALSKPYLRGVM
jgi:general nucleoside transport system permease protein